MNIVLSIAMQRERKERGRAANRWKEMTTEGCKWQIREREMRNCNWEVFVRFNLIYYLNSYALRPWKMRTEGNNVGIAKQTELHKEKEGHVWVSVPLICGKSMKIQQTASCLTVTTDEFTSKKKSTRVYRAHSCKSAELTARSECSNKGSLSRNSKGMRIFASMAL